MNRYYELDLQLEPKVETVNGTSYLVGIFRNSTTKIELDKLGDFFMPAYNNHRSNSCEIAALTEYYLEKSGIRAKIAYFYNFTGGDHAYVMVDLPSGAYFIDPTNFSDPDSGRMELIAPEDEDYRFYSEYEYLYENIYQLIEDSLTTPERRKLYLEFDWWNSPMFLIEG